MPIRHQAALIAVLTLVSVWPAAAAPPKVTLAQLIRDPDRYAQQIVAVTGQVDNCVKGFCSLCPADATPATMATARCLPMSFDGFAYPHASDLDDQAIQRTETLMDEAFRFAAVAVEARFDPTCLTGMGYADKTEKPDKGKKSGKMMIVVCTDYPIVLNDARVLKVLARKSDRDGLIGSHRYGDLTAAAPSDAAAMRTLYLDVYPDDAWREIRAFILPPLQGPLSHFDAAGLLCICRLDTCEGQWPTAYFSGFGSLAAPYACIKMVRRDAKWRVVPL